MRIKEIPVRCLDKCKFRRKGGSDVFAIVALFLPFANPSPALSLYIRQRRLGHMADQASDHLTPGGDGHFPEDP